MAYTWTNTKKPDQTVCPSFRPQIHEDYVCRRILFLPQRYFWHTPPSLCLSPLAAFNLYAPAVCDAKLITCASLVRLPPPPDRATGQPSEILTYKRICAFLGTQDDVGASVIRLERYRSVHERGTSDHTKHAKSLAPIDKLHDVFTRRKM